MPDTTTQTTNHLEEIASIAEEIGAILHEATHTHSTNEAQKDLLISAASRLCETMTATVDQLLKGDAQ